MCDDSIVGRTQATTPTQKPTCRGNSAKRQTTPNRVEIAKLPTVMLFLRHVAGQTFPRLDLKPFAEPITRMRVYATRYKAQHKTKALYSRKTTKTTDRNEASGNRGLSCSILTRRRRQFLSSHNRCATQTNFGCCLGSKQPNMWLATRFWPWDGAQPSHCRSASHVYIPQSIVCGSVGRSLWLLGLLGFTIRL